MASYVYNPSRKITEFLSQYLELPETEGTQQRISVWSGRVSLSNVTIRTSAINEHLQRYGWELQSGSIASFEMTIPLWKQLLQNKNTKLDQESGSHIAIQGLRLRFAVCPVAEEEEDKATHQDLPPRRHSPTNRRLHQKWIAEAERRRLAGLPIGPWLARLRRQQEEQEMAAAASSPRHKKKDLPTTTSDPVLQSVRGRESRLFQWIKQWTQDLLYQLFLGLTVHIDDMRVMLQFPSAPVECGLVVPALHLTNPTADPTRLHKHIHLPGLGLYVVHRKSGAMPTGEAKVESTSTILPNDYVLCPMDSDVQLTLLFSNPSSDATPAVVSSSTSTRSTTIPEEAEGEDVAEPTPKKRRRRGKREKELAVSVDTTAVIDETFSSDRTPTDRVPPSLHRARTVGATWSTATRKRSLYAAGSGSSLADIPRSQSRRSSTLSGPMARGRKFSLPPQSDNAMGLPLAQPDDLRAHFQNSAARQSEHAIQLEGKLYMGAVQFRCSSCQYRWLNQALVASRHVRHGRPCTSIRSVILQQDLLQGDDPLADESHSGHDREGGSYHPVISAWWRYAFRQVIRELRERQRSRALFHNLFMSFDWQQQAQGRKEYVRLFIASRLDHRRSADEERLLALEDELPVEQVVLYRAIARAAHVRGMHSMPSSILDLQTNDTRSILPVVVPKEKEEGGAHATADPRTHRLSLLVARGEIARARYGATALPLPNYPELLVSHAPSVEEVSFAAQTNRSNQSRRGVAGTMIDHMSSKKKDRAPRMMYSFSFQVQKLECILVDEDDRAVLDPVGKSALSDSVSMDISVLTEDDRFVPVDNELRLDESVDPINLAEMDYVLFDLPERVLLRIQICPLECSLLGDSEKSRCFNFRIGQVKATGDNDFEFLNIGSPPTDGAALADFVLTMDDLYPSVAKSGADSNKDAVFLSLVVSNHHNFLQCDTPALRVSLEPFTLGKISSFLAKDAAHFPPPLLEISPRENVRRYVLREQYQTKSFNLNCSIRMQGFELHLCASRPTDAPLKSDASVTQRLLTALALRCSMIEVYSGSAVAELSASLEERQQFVSIETRQLSMLDLTSTNPSLLSFRWVMAINGLDVVLSPSSKGSKSLLREVFTVEMLYSNNLNSLLDFNRSKEELVLEVSPIHVMLSEECILEFAKIEFEKYLQLSSNSVKVDRKQPLLLPPRLEVLSSYMRYQLDVTVRGLRCSFLSETNTASTPVSLRSVMDGAMIDFLRMASSYDLQFPHEDAIDAAMQICVDRLVGLGLPIEVAFEAVNRVLLLFLDEVVDEPPGNSETSHDPSNAETYSEIWKGTVMEKAVVATSAAYLEYLDHDTLDFLFSFSRHDLDIDIPGGVYFTWVSLFYDQHFSLYVPSLSIVDGDGLHLLHVASHEVDEPSRSSMSNISDNMALSELSPVNSPSTRYGIAFQVFHLDKGHHFGRGGLPLSILGADGIVLESDLRICERFFDLDFDELEFIFARPVLDNILSSLRRIFAPFLQGSSSANGSSTFGKNPVLTTVDAFSLVKCSSISFLFVSDDLNPFMRLSAADFILKSERLMSLLLQGEEAARTTRFKGRSCSLLNLTKDGELFPDVISVLPSHTSECLSATIGPTAGIDVAVSGLRVYFLKQFLSEVLQYFVNGQYGLSRLLRERMLPDGRPGSGTPSSEKRTVSFRDISILFPRSCGSLDLMCVELSNASLFFCRTAESFVMPSSVNSINFDDISCNADGSGICPGQPISRLRICLIGFRIFSALAVRDNGVTSSRESPSFRAKFMLDGRAEAGKRVFCPIYKDSTIANDFLDDDATNKRTQCCWSEITAHICSLEIVVDHAPHLRLLIVDHPDDKFSDGLSLDMQLSQFCMLLSIWFSNLQELPQLFPYSMSQLQRGAKPLEVLSTIPDYGSESLRTFLKSNVGRTSEVAIVLRSMTFRCVSDDIISQERAAREQGFVVGFNDVVVYVTNDKHGVARIGVGSSSASFCDESLQFSSILSFTHENCERSWADLEFGLDRVHTLPNCLPQAFQLSIFLIPGWQIYNLGLNSPQVILSDLSPIYKFLKFVSTYFTDNRFGNPSLIALDQIKQMKIDMKNESPGGLIPDSSLNGVNVSSMDFRLWLANPFLSMPCNPVDEFSSGLRIEGEGGFWYQYMTIGEFSSQQCVSDCLHMSFDKRILLQPSDVVNFHSESKLVENLSLGLRLDSNSVSGHTDVCVQIPFDSTNACDITSPRIYLSPDVFAPPIICSPHEDLTRSLGPSVCEVTCLVEILPLAYSTLLNFLAGGTDDVEIVMSSFREAAAVDSKCFTDPVYKKSELSNMKVNNNQNTFSVVAAVRNARFFVLDPVLGPYLPLAVLSISSLSVTSSYFANEPTENHLGSDGVPSEDLQVAAVCHLWADYFKLGLTRSWEPLIEAYRFRCNFEKSRNRGSGLSFNSDSRLHFNVSSSLLIVMDEVFSDLMQSMSRAFMYESTFTKDIDESKKSPSLTRQAVSDSIFGINITHNRTGPVAKEERVAFLLRNMTGQKMRIIRPAERVIEIAHPAVVTYLENREATELTFPPCISVVKNLKVKEVAYPGLPNRTKEVQGNVSQHLIDLQIPGFHWLDGIEVDTFGRKFFKIFPRSPDVRTKVEDDWRLANMMQLLVEVGLRNGGRQVTVRSVVSVINKTTHDLSLRLDPDPLIKPQELSHSGLESTKKMIMDIPSDFELCPGESLQVPTLLLESSLRFPGSNLGCLWIRPTRRSFNAETFVSSSVDKLYLADEVEIAFSSRHVPLIKLVKESSTMFEAARFRPLGPNQAKTKLQLSCPVARSSGDRLAPFCYAVEIDRSPIVPSREKFFGEKRSDRTHAPVTYALIVHPPIIIENFLPEKGRFELMHAVNRIVLWSGELEPGQQVSVHSVGLDAPLLLFLNLGFAKTPVGDGALVHHGSDLPPSVRDNLMGLKSIGKAGKAVTKKIGKTLSSIGESPDRRGLKRIFMAQNPQMQSLQPMSRQSHLKANVDVDSGEDSNDENFDGKTYKIDNFHYFADDVARQTIIVDSLGQKLLLSIENIRGGGGQRKITVFCRYWILNATEHCLRYKQDGSKAFVTGTVLSPIRDGSLPLSGARSRSNYGKDGRDYLGLGRGQAPHTIFAGTPGALASSPGRCALPSDHVARLLDSQLPVEQIAQWAFMFNFHDGPVVSIGQQKLCVQLWDGTGTTKYVSDWSRGFGLDSVGVSQTIEMHCKDGRVLELSAFVSVAPGYLSGYTTIVRFLPRYAVVNNLPYQIRLWQDSSLFRPFSAQGNSSWETASKWQYGHQKQSKVNQYELLWGRKAVLDESESSLSPIGTTAHGSALFIGTILPNEILPFCLPDSRGERQLRVDTGNPWSLSGSISADKPGDFILAINRTADLKATPHVSTRSNPHYEVRLPPHGSDYFDEELGIWFEPDYGIDRGLIVKAVKKNTYAFNETDVHVGDELFLMDGVLLSNMLFTEAVSKLKSRLAELASKIMVDVHRRSTIKYGRSSTMNPRDGRPLTTSPVVLTFRTIEERTRKVRQRAADVNEVEYQSGLHHLPPNRPDSGEKLSSESETSFYIRADLKSSARSNLGNFLILREQPNAPYEIQNQSVAYTLYYRQRGCLHCCWQVLKPGQSTSYSWEEPLKPKKIIARVALDSVFFSGKMKTENSATKKEMKRPMHRDDHQKILDEESFFSPSVVVPLEEVGFCELVSLAANSLDYDETLPSVKYLKLVVDVEGTARVLALRDSSDEGNDIEAHIAQSVEKLRLKIQQDERRILDLSSLKQSMDGSGDGRVSDEIDPGIVNSFARQLESVVSTPFITGCHQIAVEILEARGLNPESVVDSCNPYCEVRLKDRYERKVLLGNTDRRKTYCIRKTVSPVWKDQAFIFHVPSRAVAATYGYSIRLRVRNFRMLGRHQILGRAQVDLHSVRDQEPLTGWFPLVGRTDRRELDTQISHWGRGSIKLRVQWIYTLPGLVQYFILLSEHRRSTFAECLAGLAIQESKRNEAEKQRRAEIDGLKAVRMEELLSFRKKSRQRLIVDQMQLNRQKVGASYVKTPGRRDSIEPRLIVSDESRLDSGTQVVSPDLLGPVSRTHLRLKDVSRAVLLHNLLDHHGLRKRANSSHNVAHELEDQISQRRQNFHRYNSSKQDHFGGGVDGNGIFALNFFRTWNMVQAFFNDSNLDFKLRENSIKVNFRTNMSCGLRRTLSSDRADFSIEKKFRCPPSAPPLIRLHADLKVNQFLQSRRSFERSARISMRTVLHSGGWLSIRPVSSLNLPDMYTGMAVKVKYGAETFVSETADARSLDPSWFRMKPDVDEDEQWDIVSQGDIHIHIAPQKTSGAIRLSVIGEKGHKQFSSSTKHEVGVLYLPLGATISACLDHEENRLIGETDLPMLLRWFPLTTPLGSVKVEGDEGLTSRPTDSEKMRDTEFKEYFAPCIQLAIFWTPENDTAGTKRDDASQRSYNNINQSHSSPDSPKVNEHMDEPIVRSYFNADISWVSVALLDSQRARELLALSLREIDVRYWVTTAKTRVGFSIGWLQLDYQDDDVREPVVLAPTPTDVLLPVIQALVLKDNLRSVTEVMSFDFIDISIAELDFTIEERLLFDLVMFWSSIRTRKASEISRLSSTASLGFFEHLFSLNQKDDVVDLYASLTQDNGKSEDKQKIYIKDLAIGVVKINISYLKGKVRESLVDMPVDRVLRLAGGELLQQFFYKDDTEDFYTVWSQTTLDDELRAMNEGKDSQNIPSFFATLFPNVSDAPLRLPGKSVKHTFESASDIAGSIRKFYTTEALKQFYKIVGALDFVGNPTMLVTSFFSGVRDLVVTPHAAIMSSPRDPSRLGIGFAKGTLSFVSHGVSGFFGYTSKLAAAAGQAVATVSLDAEFRDWHNDKVVVAATNLNREWKRRGVQNVGMMLSRPIVDLALGVAGGVSGVVISPVKGFRKNGPAGLPLGVAIGGIGFFAKPLVGMMDAVVHFSASIHDIAKSVNVLDRRLQPALKLRLPYVFGWMSILAPFRSSEARAVQLLKTFPARENHRRSEDQQNFSECLIHVETLPSMGTEVFVLVTNLRVSLIRVKKEMSGILTTTLCMEVYFAEDVNISSKVDDFGHNSVALIIYKRDRDKLTRNDSKRNGTLFALSPPLAWKTVTWRSMPGLGSPDAATTAGTTIVSDHLDVDDATGDDGNLLDKFTVLADYQYRPQLTRLHNAICCVSGDLDSVVPVSWHAAGNFVSTDGHTSFGMYYFDKETDADTLRTASHSSATRFEHLPWVPRNAFDLVSKESAEDQLLFLSRLREDFSFEKELERSQYEGGPDWLVVARARVFLEEKLRLASILQRGTVTKKMAESQQDIMPSILDVDDSENEEIVGMGPTSSLTVRTPSVRDSLSLYKSAFQSYTTGNRRDDTVLGSMPDSSDQLNDVDHTNEEEDDIPDMEPHDSSEVSNVLTQFRRRRAKFQSPMASSFSTNDASSVQETRRRSNRTSTSQENAALLPEEVPDESIWMDPLDSNNETEAASLAPTAPEAVALDAAPSVAAQDGAEEIIPANQVERHPDRLDRMENILEQLLLFNSQQALLLQQQQVATRSRPEELPTATPESNVEIGALRREIQELRAQLQEVVGHTRGHDNHRSHREDA